MGKSSINGPFSMAMLNSQMVGSTDLFSSCMNSFDSTKFYHSTILYLYGQVCRLDISGKSRNEIGDVNQPSVGSLKRDNRRTARKLVGKSTKISPTMYIYIYRYICNYMYVCIGCLLTKSMMLAKLLKCVNFKQPK